MTGCFTWLVLLAGAIFLLMSFLRWFEQTADAVDAGRWDKLALLLAFPFAAWLYPSRVRAGRATPVPRHEPVRGFGVPREKPRVMVDPGDEEPARDGPVLRATNEDDVPMARVADDGPPPGTPPEFLGKPVIPPPKKKSPRAAAVDPDKLAKLRQKMREQGMLPPDEGRGSSEG
jgi:hypothetical protein